MKLHFQADDIRLSVAPDSSGNLSPSLASARNGSILIEFPKSELQAMALAFAQAGASEQGAKVDSVELSLASAGDRAVTVAIRMKARKGFIPAVVNVSGRTDVDEKLSATLSGLSCTGEGMIGSVVAGMIRAKLAPLEGREFPLAREQLKNLRLGAINVDAGDPLRLTATFES